MPDSRVNHQREQVAGALLTPTANGSFDLILYRWALTKSRLGIQESPLALGSSLSPEERKKTT